MKICCFTKIWRIITWPLGCHSLNLCFSFIFYVATLSTHGHETPWTRKNIESQRFPRGHAITCPRFPVATKKLTAESQVIKNSYVATSLIYNKGKTWPRETWPVFPLIFVFFLSRKFCHHPKPLSAKQLMGFVTFCHLHLVTKLSTSLSLGFQGFNRDEKVGFVTTCRDKTPSWRCSWAG